MASKHREQHIREAVPCPVCGAPIGQACRKGVRAHDPRRGQEDLREHMLRAHDERKFAWQEWKRLRGGPSMTAPLLPLPRIPR